MHNQATSAVEHAFSEDVVRLLRQVYGNETDKCLKLLPTTAELFFFRANTLRAGIEQVQQSLRRSGIESSTHPRISEAISTPTSGPFEIPTLNLRVVVDKFTAEAVLQGANVYAPGVLSCQGLRAGQKVTVVDRLHEPVALGIARMGENEILTFRKGLAIETQLARYQVPNLRALKEFADGSLYPQSLPSIVVGRVLAPAPTETIVDLTCSPGGKLSHICQLTFNQAKLIGIDRNPRKIEVTKRTLERLGCSNVTLLVCDARRVPEELTDLKADKVLVDPPCSALGLRPKLFDYSTFERVEGLAAYQKQLLRAAARLVTMGGTVVYSVCTVTKQECEEVAQFGIDKCGLELVEQEPVIGDAGEPPFHYCQRFHPHVHGTGYFIAKFRKT